MSLAPIFHWLTHTQFSIYLRQSTWDFAIIEMFHLLGLAVLGGAILLVDLRLLGLGLRRISPSKVARELTPVLLISLLVMLISGGLMLTAAPMKYYLNSWFRWKMLFLLLAVSFYFTFHAKMVRSNDTMTTSIGSKIAAVVSLVLWLGVGLAGRAIGFL